MNAFLRPARAWLLCLSLAAACGSSSPSHSVAAKNYNRACTSVADCFPVYEGPVGCCGGGCPNTAIRADSLTQYMSAFQSASTASCNGLQPPCPAIDPGSCPAGRVQCVNGTCQLEMAVTDGSATD